MSPERRREVEELYHAARERGREALAGADPELRREAEELLARDSDGFPDRPAAYSEDSTVTGAACLPSNLAGQTVSHYKILEKLGAGGMGVVYKAFDSKLDRLVALKFLPPDMRHDEAMKRRLTQEARAASALHHPNIVVVYEIDETPGGAIFIAMAFHEGPTLRVTIAKDGIPSGMPVAEALQIARQIASGLAKAHEHGIVHRDIKPANILTGTDGIVRIIDFGLAKSVESTATLDGTTKGTPLYMSPEQASGKAVDGRTDLWSLGAVLYEMLAGRPPFPGDTHLQVMHAIVYDAPPQLRDLRPELPLEVESMVARALEKDPAKRYQSAAEMVGDLSAALAAIDGSAGKPTRSRPARTAKAMIPAAAGAAVLALLAAGYFSLHGKPKLTDKDTVVLADFENKTGDPVFDGTLRQGMAVQLEQSPFLSLVADQRIQHVLGLMGQPPDAKLTPRIAKEVCERAGSTAVLDGSITPVGSEYVLGLRATNCRTGDVLDEEQVQAAKKEDVLNALTQISSKFRTRIGESLAMVERHDTPLPEATTPSLDALKAYSTAQKVWQSAWAGAAMPHFQRAIEIDPQFAMAHAWLGRVYAELWEPVLAAESANRAYQLRNRVSDPERFFIMVPHDLDVTGNLEKAYQTAESWADAYPRDVRPRAYLSWMDQLLGKYEKSVEDAQKAVALDPDFPPAFNNLAWAYIQLNRLPEAENTIRQATGRKVPGEYPLMRFPIAFLRGDQAGMLREAAQSEGNAQFGDQILNNESKVLAYSGRLPEARRKSRQAVDATRRAAHKQERAAMWEAVAAVREAFFGNAREARQHAAAALDFSRGRPVEYGAALALALVGDTAQSQAVAKDLEKASEDTYAQFVDLPTLRALWALSQGDSANALEALQIAAPYEMGVGSAGGEFGVLYPAYVRGQAYLVAGRAADAAAEFQKILDWPGLVGVDPVGALARLQSGKAFALSGDTAKAKAAYQDFLTLWKDAERDIPILRQAQAEFGKLP
ncbi:MAG: protein kinase domain-containing protein [Bryobacteraceae bacterium]